MLDKTGFTAPPVRRSPLEHRLPISSNDGRTALLERKFTGKLIMRGEAGQISPLIEAAIGAALPVAPCTSAVSATFTILWLGPSEWMLLTPENDEGATAEKLQFALGGVPHQITDVTDHYTIIRLSGERSRDMLMKLTTLDTHPARFPSGAAKGSMFGRVPATLHLTADSPDCFDLVIRRSHADYLWRLLALAGYEYGFPEQEAAGRVKLATP